MRVDLHPEAEAELASDTEWLAARSVGAAERLQFSVAAGLALLEAFPRSGERYGRRYRRHALPGLAYVLFYRVRRDSVLVLAVAHTSRRPNYWRHRDR